MTYRSQFAGIDFTTPAFLSKYFKNSEVNMKTVSPRILYVDADEDSGKIIDKLILFNKNNKWNHSICKNNFISKKRKQHTYVHIRIELNLTFSISRQQTCQDFVSRHVTKIVALQLNFM